MKIHKTKDNRKSFLLNSDGSWNVVCKNTNSSSCKSNKQWDFVTCKRCLRQKPPTKQEGKWKKKKAEC